MNQDERGLMQKHLELEEKWRPLNHGACCLCDHCQSHYGDKYDRIVQAISWISGVAVALCALVEIAHHVLRLF